MVRRRAYFFIFLVIGVLITAVFFIEPPPAFLFQNAKGDCSGRSQFMYNAIYKNKAEAEVVLFGSSKTLNGINDSMLNRLGGKTFLNLGYCRFGRNLDCFFIEEYCKIHHPKIIVLELRQQESQNTHPLSAYLMPLSGVVKTAGQFNKDFFSDIYNKWLCNLKYIRNNLFLKPDMEPEAEDIKGGFWPGNGQPTVAQLNKDRLQDSVQQSKIKPVSLSNSANYFEQLKAFCAVKQIKLCFLYLSNYGNAKPKPDCYAKFKTYGPVLCLPDSLLQNPADFSDLGHFNIRGANKASLWLNEQLTLN